VLDWLRDFIPDDARGLLWLGVGLFGQALFFSRWIVQWLASEKRKESTMPLSFWYFSLIGSVLVLAYAIRNREPVLVIGQGTGTLIYVRNLMLLSRMRTRHRTLERPEEGTR
jgi:lipid-A-disaccharide synthase-like uncharacterized protein